jgi:hypothetical protein
MSGLSEVVINHDSTYKRLFGNDCPSDIDFTSETLLGIETTGGCETRLVREVLSRPESSSYLYKLIISECGLCKKLSHVQSWVVVPKLPEGWTVQFEKRRR